MNPQNQTAGNADRSEGTKRRRVEDSPGDKSSAGCASYCLVEFLKDNSTASVPLSWVEQYEGETFCYWPSKYKSKEYRQAVLQSETPDKNAWDSFLAKIHSSGTLAECKSNERHLIAEGSGFDEDPKYRKKKVKSSKESSNGDDKEPPASDQPTPRPPVPGSTPLATLCYSCAKCTSCADYRDANDSFERKVLRLLRKIHGNITVVTEGRPVVVEPLTLGEIRLPLRTITAIGNAEKSLTPELIIKLKSNLKQYVSNSVWKTAVDMMQSVLSISVMKELNWEGRNKGKIGFAKIAPKLSQVIIDGAREATVDDFKPSAMRDRLMKVLVKAHKLQVPRAAGAPAAEGVPVENGTDDSNGTNTEDPKEPSNDVENVNK